MPDPNEEILDRFLNKEIPDKDFVFRRVFIKAFTDSDEVEHLLSMVSSFFGNRDGDGMSVDWEHICKDPKTTQMRDDRNPSEFGVIVMSVFDVKKSPDTLNIISDQKYYKEHCLITGIPRSKRKLKQFKKDGEISEEEYKEKNLILISIRRFLKRKAFWVIPFEEEGLDNPPSNFNYFELFTERIKHFFISRNHNIPFS